MLYEETISRIDAEKEDALKLVVGSRRVCDVIDGAVAFCDRSGSLKARAHFPVGPLSVKCPILVLDVLEFLEEQLGNVVYVRRYEFAGAHVVAWMRRDGACRRVQVGTQPVHELRCG